MHHVVGFTARGMARRLMKLSLLFVLAFMTGAFALHAQDDANGEFEIIRTALREKFDLRLNLIDDWGWEQVNFTDGIESCISEDQRTGAFAAVGREYFVEPGNGIRYIVRISYDQSVIVVCDNPQHDAWAAGETQTAAQEAPPAEAPTEAPADQASAEAPTEAPTEAPAANAALPAPAAGSANLSGFALGGHVQDMSGATFGYMQRAGMTWVKRQVRYSLGDNPGNVADAINAAHANGYHILLGIVGRTEQMGDFQSYINTYSQYVAGVAALGADAIEVWNEPNIDREWPASSINGGQYTQLLAAAYNAIKAANGGTWVISGAPAPTGYFGSAGCGSGGCNDDVFMQQMADAGAARYLDCIGLHYNEGIIAPDQNGGDPRGSYPTYYFSSMLQRGYGRFGGKPVCFTELGYLSGEDYDTPIPPNFGWAGNTTVAQHAAWLAEAASMAARSGRVRLMIVWNVDFRDFTPTDPMGGYAMVRPDGGCPACDSLGAVMH